MVDFFNQKNKIKEFDDTLKMVADAFDLDSLKARVDVLTKEQHSDGFWDNMAHAGEVNRELKMLETKIQKFEKVRAEVEDVKVLIELAEEADDESEVESVNAEIAGLTDKIEHLRLDALLKGKYDSLNAIITLHAGAGGTEAQDWVQMLYRMYSRYIERKGYQMKVLDLLEGCNPAGFGFLVKVPANVVAVVLDVFLQPRHQVFAGLLVSNALPPAEVVQAIVGEVQILVGVQANDGCHPAHVVDWHVADVDDLGIWPEAPASF